MPIHHCSTSIGLSSVAFPPKSVSAVAAAFLVVAAHENRLSRTPDPRRLVLQVLVLQDGYGQGKSLASGECGEQEVVVGP